MKKLECPSCGGTLGIPDRHERMFKCSYCGSVIEDQAVNPTLGSEPDATPTLTVATHTVDITSLVTYSAPKPRVGIIAIAAIVVMGFGLAAALIPLAVDNVGDAVGSGSSSSPGLSGTSFRSGVALPGDGADGAAVMAVVQDGTDHVVHYLDLDAAEPTRWHSTLGAEANVFDQYLHAPDAVYLVAEDQLFAWDRAGGERLFAVTLSDSISANICDDCIRLIGDSLVTLTADGVLAGFDPTTGQAKWATTLTAVPRQLLDFGGSAAVLDDGEDGDTALKVYDVTNGGLTATVALRCQDGNGAGIYDYLLPLPDGGFFWEGTNIISSCAQRFSPGSTSPMWESPLPDGGISVDNDAAIFTVVADRAVAVHRGTISWYALDNGARTQTVRENEDLVILGTGDGRLYMGAESTRGTSKWSILALDPATGEVAWTHDPGTARITGFSQMSITRSGWLVEPVDGGLILVTNDDDAESLRLQVLSAEHGTSTDAVTVDLDPYAFIVWPSIFGSEDGNLVVGVGTTVLVIDPTSGEIVTRAP